MKAPQRKLSDLQLRILEKGQLCCADIKRVYGEYSEGDLSATVRARVDAHVAGCPECGQFITEYNEVIELARELGRQQSNALESGSVEESIPTDVQNRLRQALNVRLGVNLPFIA